MNDLFSLRTLLFAFISALYICSAAQNPISFKRINSDNGLPCDETNCVAQDKEGYIWIGSQYGLYKYDGYQIQEMDALKGKNISHILDGGDSFLWIGTNEGLFKLDKKTLSTQNYQLKEYDNCNRISRVLIDSRDSTWIGTEGGLYSYDKDADTLVFRCDKNFRSAVPHCSVTDIREDRNGFIWIGTWDKGLFRYNTRNGKWYSMPKFNDTNSAQKIYAGIDGKLWVGTWGYGLYEIINPYETNKPLLFHNYMNHGTSASKTELMGNYIYSICKNEDDGNLWIGTNNGLSICTIEDNGDVSFDNYPKHNEDVTSFLGTGVESLFNDHTGIMWMCTTQNGVVSAKKQATIFNTVSYFNLFGNTTENITNSLTVAPNGSIYVGLKNIGFANIKYNAGEFSSIIATQELTGTNQVRSSREVYILSDGGTATGTESKGCFIKHPGSSILQYNKDNCEWLNDNCVLCFYEETDGTLLIGNWRGISVLYPDGSGRNLSEESGNKSFDITRVKCIIKAGKNDYWISSSNNGILHIYGNLCDKQLNAKSLRIKYYDDIPYVSRLLYTKNNEIWACSPSGGLMKYDVTTDMFVNMTDMLSFPAQIVSDMEEDHNGNLWFTTNLGIIRLSQNPTRIRIFTKSDGLPTNYLGRSLIRRMNNGDMCVSYTDYLTIFSPSQAETNQPSYPARITNLKIFNKKTNDYQDGIITVEHNENDITIDFSTLTYDNLSNIRFSYMLEGFDHDWVYPQIGRYSAYYSNLPSGSYTFRLRSSDANGIWTDSPEQLTITVLPPLYLRWWAILGYIIALLGVITFIFHYFKHKRKQKEEVKLAKLQAEQVEELNHKKLQFFTNISHDLMTPLTIISAITESTSEDTMPQKEVMKNNVSKLIRMLQQILEFRKMESGNLSLRVSERDIVAFCRNEVESITPLMNSKGIDFEFYSNQSLYKCWFDVDALDKILYNLLSNAAKYSNQDNGKVKLMLNCGPTVKISVSDNGPGISENHQKDLFKRFYEGDHRKFNTYGTGIGLSLTRDLTSLHHGTIDVESKEGQGTTFTVTLPVTRSAFTDSETEGIMPKPNGNSHKDDIEDVSSTLENKTNKTILIVEDNEELRSIVKKALSPQYNVEVSDNGKEALELMRSPDNMIDLVLSDVMMPEMDGMELTRIIKSDIETSHIPVLLLTAKRTDEDRTEAYRLGADGYITKPFSMELLLARVENLLQRRKHMVERIETSLSFNSPHSPLFMDNDKEHMNITPLDAFFIRRCHECVMSHIDDTSFSQQMFADEMNVSKSTLYKKLRALTNKNTPQFIRSIRMSMAVKILKENPYIRVSELAYSVGFNDPKYFSQCFKADFGMLPSDYITSHNK